LFIENWILKKSKQVTHTELNKKEFFDKFNAYFSQATFYR